ncbi:MAG: hypothetical protein ACK4TG_07125, partial [Thermaurantiacus sp.]
ELDRALARAPAMEQFLAQAPDETADFRASVVALMEGWGA